MDKSYVVAGNMDEFRRFVNRKKTEHDKANEIMPRYIFVHSADTLRGSSEVHGWFTGTYQRRSDIEQIKTMILVINSRKSSTIKITSNPTENKIRGKEITGVWLDELGSNN